MPAKSYQPISAEDGDVPESKDEETGEEERREWIEAHMRAVEQAEKSYERERQRLSELRAEFCRTLEDTLFKESTASSPADISHAAASASSAAQGPLEIFQKVTSIFSPPSKQTAYIRTLRGEVNRDQKNIAELKEKQQNLIMDMLAVFAHHKDQSDELLQQLEKEKTADIVQQLQYCKELFKSANEEAEKLKKESAKKACNFGPCRGYIINAGQFYQMGYDRIIALTKQKSALGNMQVQSKISVDNTTIVAGDNVHIGNILMVAKQELKDELGDKQKAFNRINNDYDDLQQCHQKNVNELAAVKLQQADLSQRAKTLIRQIAEARQEARNSAAKIKQARDEITVMDSRIAKLEAESAAKTEQIARAKKANNYTPAAAATVAGLMPKPNGQQVVGDNSGHAIAASAAAVGAQPQR
jgi:chromosome segregation ATPase